MPIDEVLQAFVLSHGAKLSALGAGRHGAEDNLTPRAPQAVPRAVMAGLGRAIHDFAPARDSPFAVRSQRGRLAMIARRGYG
jgi:hypothetical protein